MITHGKKQISEIVYARKASEGGGAVRLTNIIRGAQVVFGVLDPKVNWLKAATTQAILAAFGQDDGYAVLGATNAYLNALAATDPTKATALAGFINEDPMLVCSLGLQPKGVTMPIRMLEIVGKSYFKSGEMMRAGIGIESLLFITAANGELWGTGNRNKRMTSWAIGGNNWRYMGQHISVPNWCPTTKPIKVRQDYTGVYIDGVKNGSYPTVTGTTEYEVWLGGHDSFMSGRAAYWLMFDYDTMIHCFYPIKRNNTMELVDVYTGTLATRTGTWTEKFYLPDGTPWTPLNQTP